jgi:hypothetical protein
MAVADDLRNTRVCGCWMAYGLWLSNAKSGSGGPEIEISLPPGFSTLRDFWSVSPSRLFRRCRSLTGP